MSDNVFHDHLDVCKQCREHPFALCRLGADALKKAVQDLALDNPFVFDVLDKLAAKESP